MATKKANVHSKKKSKSNQSERVKTYHNHPLLESILDIFNI
jgi:hypothetical protein